MNADIGSNLNHDLVILVEMRQLPLQMEEVLAIERQCQRVKRNHHRQDPTPDLIQPLSLCYTATHPVRHMRALGLRCWNMQQTISFSDPKPKNPKLS